MWAGMGSKVLIREGECEWCFGEGISVLIKQRENVAKSVKWLTEKSVNLIYLEDREVHIYLLTFV